MVFHIQVWQTQSAQFRQPIKTWILCLMVFAFLKTKTKLQTRVSLKNIHLSEIVNYNKVIRQCATLASISFFQGVELQDSDQQWLTAKTFQNRDFFCLIEKFQWDYRGRLWNSGFPTAVPGASIVKMLCDISDQSKSWRPLWFNWCGLSVVSKKKHSDCKFDETTTYSR